MAEVGGSFTLYKVNMLIVIDINCRTRSYPDFMVMIEEEISVDQNGVDMAFSVRNRFTGNAREPVVM